MNAKKLCCLVTVTAMLFFGLPAIPFANVDRVPQLSQEELGLVFQNPDSTWNGKPEFLKYLDEKEMKETEGKAVQLAIGGVGGGFVGGIVGGALAYQNGGSVLKGVLAGALGGALAGTGLGMLVAKGEAIGLRALASMNLPISFGTGIAGGCYLCHGVRPQGEH